MSSRNKINNRTFDNKSAYDQWSTFYDEYPNPTVAMDEKSFPALWAHHTGQKILEIGCGTGRHTQKLVARGNNVTALDLSAGMLAVARKKIPAATVTFIEADFLTYEGLANYDVVLESLVLEHFPDLNTFFERVSRVLKSQGDLYLSEIHPVRAQAGIMAHFKGTEDEEVHLTSHPHPEEHFLRAAGKQGFTLVNSWDVNGDEDLARIKPTWSRHLGLPMTRMWHFLKN